MAQSTCQFLQALPLAPIWLLVIADAGKAPKPQLRLSMATYSSRAPVSPICVMGMKTLLASFAMMVK